MASLLIPFNIQLGTVFEVINKPQISFYINLISNILNVILNIFLIRAFGIIGSACAFAITIIFIYGIG
jgi:O-antigen/teichoic acid export membrane protein